MAEPLTTQTRDDGAASSATPGESSPLALVVVWCGAEPERVGEVLHVPEGKSLVFGREAAGEEPGPDRASLVRERPSGRDRAAPYANPFVSRAQLRLTAERDCVRVENLGRREIAIDDLLGLRGTLSVGSTLAIRGQILFVCVARSAMPPVGASGSSHPFGEVDALGLVGESPATWKLREQIVFVARRAPHVLLLGESGTGKELVAEAIHRLSPRAGKRIVARNAATFPAGLIDAELFGNVAGYPNPGMPDRPGVIGEADGSTLFLDEIGELPVDLQAHLLRFLDGRGEYQKLGDARRRTADVRVVAATNRDVASLKHDLAARMHLRVQLPSLAARREDVPLLARHLLKRIVARDPEVGARFGTKGAPTMTARLTRALVAHDYTTHVRELESFLWCALSTSSGAELDLTDELRARMGLARAYDVPPPPPRRDVGLDEIRAAMQKHGGVHEKVWRELGLSNRHVLQRLLKKHEGSLRERE